MEKFTNIIGVILFFPFVVVFWAAVQLVDTFLPHG
jgi:hypothetical protein